MPNYNAERNSTGQFAQTDCLSRFWSKVDMREPGDCWEWQACCDRYGYGRFRAGGKMKFAHRVAWELTEGPIPPGQCVCHRCDNPGCVNPAHLFLGTRADNSADMTTKGRQAAGEANARSKLTTAQVLEIRRRYAEGNVTQRALGQEYGVSHALIGCIVRRENWMHS